MEEWKRIFCGRRIGFLFALALLCAGLFLLSQFSQMRPGEFDRIIASSQYAVSLMERWRGSNLDELPDLLEAERARRNAIDDWCYFYYWGFEPSSELQYGSEDEALSSFMDIPLLVGSVQESAKTFSMNDLALWETLTRLDEEIDYLLGYPAYLENVQKQAERQYKSGIFNVDGSFSKRNLQKTAMDFEGMRGVEVSFGNSQGIERWMEFQLGDYFHLIGIALFVMAFLEERKKGLWCVVRTCRNGRFLLGIRRVGALAVASALCTGLFCGIPLVEALFLYGGWADVGRTLQSVESFRTCTLHTTIGGWLVQYFLVKFAMGLLIGLLLWCILGSIVNVEFSLPVLSMVLVVEYAFYRLLPVQSLFNVLKYLNIFAYVHTSELYTNYLNVNLFGFPLGLRLLLLGTVPAFVAVLVAWAVCGLSFRRPEGHHDFLGKLALRWNRLVDQVRIRMTLGGWEIYKTLILGYGVFLLLLAFWASQGLSYILLLPSHTDQWYDNYLSDLEGPIDDDTDDYFAAARAYAGIAADAPTLNNALDQLEIRVDELCNRAAEGGYEPWLVDSSPYDAVYGEGSEQVQRSNAAVAVIFLAVCCASLGVYERQAGTVCLLRSLQRGRRGLFVRKVATAALMAIFIWALIYMRELNVFWNCFRPVSLDAPVQNLDALAAFPAPFTIREYLFSLYAVRLIMLIAETWVVLLLSQLAPNLPAAYLLNVGILGIPSILMTFGADMLEWVCPVVPVSSAEVLWNFGGGSVEGSVSWVLWLIVALSALYIYYRKWAK